MKIETTTRDTRLDAIRGLFLMIMAAVHVPTPLSHRLQEPFGYVSVAEGFIFVSACLAGLIYGKAGRETAWQSMAGRVWRRARLIYLIHLGLLMPVALIAWATAGQLLPLTNHFHDFLGHPLASLALMPLLLHQPPLFDILPLYVLLLGVTPLLLGWTNRHGWRTVVMCSALGWLMAQFSLVNHYSLPLTLLPVKLGSFNLLAWQFLWICGLALGDTAKKNPLHRSANRTGLVVAAAGIVVVGLLSRHGFWPAAWFNPDVYLWMDKWTLGPLRLLNFTAWVVLLLAWNPTPPTAVLAPAALLGRHSLAVFAFHLPLAITADVLVQLFPLSTMEAWWVGVMVVAALFPWAVWLEDRRQRARGETPRLASRKVETSLAGGFVLAKSASSTP